MSLERRKKELELARVSLAKEELLFKIEERKDEIRRLEDHVKIQEQKEIELKQDIKKIN